MNRTKKLIKLDTLLSTQEMVEGILDDLEPTITEDTSDEEVMKYGRMQATVLILETKIRLLRHKLGIKQTRFKYLK